MGPASIERAVTDVLCVSPNGDGSDGSSWTNAYTTVQDALDAASTDGDDCTLILISPHTTYYDINTTGDPTWTGNYILKGTHRTWAKIKNDHASATSVMKFTGKTSLIDLNINLGTSNNGVILTHGGWRVYNCQFVGEDLTSAKDALQITGASQIKHGRLVECNFRGEGMTHMTGIKLTKVACSYFKDARIHNCKTGIQIVDADSDHNLFRFFDVGNCGIGFDIDTGDVQALQEIYFHDNTTNIDDEVKNHAYENLIGAFPIVVLPDDLTGTVVTAGAGANNYGNDTEIIAANAIDQPFKIVGVILNVAAGEKYKIKLSADSGSTFFDEFMIEGATQTFARLIASSPSGTEFIHNTDTRISAKAKSESGGNNISVWIAVQKI